MVKLDGNQLGFKGLSKLYKLFTKLGMNSLRELSLDGCEIGCTCSEKDS